MKLWILCSAVLLFFLLGPEAYALDYIDERLEWGQSREIVLEIMNSRKDTRQWPNLELLRPPDDKKKAIGVKESFSIWSHKYGSVRADFFFSPQKQKLVNIEVSFDWTISEGWKADIWSAFQYDLNSRYGQPIYVHPRRPQYMIWRTTGSILTAADNPPDGSNKKNKITMSFAPRPGSVLKKKSPAPVQQRPSRPKIFLTTLLKS